MKGTQKKSELIAVWLIILSGTLYGSLGYFGTQLIKENLTISTMLFWRFLFAAIWMLLWSSWQTKKLQLQKFKDKKAIWVLLLTGFFYSGSSLFYFYASKDAGTGLAMVIFFSYPIFVALLVWLQNYSSINRYSALSLIILVMGLFLLQKNNYSPIKITSILFALTASFSYALYLYKSKQVLHEFKAEYFTLIVCAISALVFLAASLASNAFMIPSSLKAWSYVFCLGIIATALPIQLMLEGLKSVSSLKASILSALEPVVTLLIGVIALDEALSISQVIGVVVILAGTFIIQFARD